MSGLKMGVRQAGFGRPVARNVDDNWKEEAVEVSQKSRTKFNQLQVMIGKLKMIRIPS